MLQAMCLQGDHGMFSGENTDEKERQSLWQD